MRADLLTCVAPVMLCSVSVEDVGSLDFSELDVAVHFGVLLDTSRLEEVAQDINDNLDVDGLCREFPYRIADVISRGGDRLPK